MSETGSRGSALSWIGRRARAGVETTSPPCARVVDGAAQFGPGWSLEPCLKGQFFLTNRSDGPARRVAITSAGDSVVVIDEHGGQDIAPGSSRVFAAMVGRGADVRVRISWTDANGERHDWRTDLPAPVTAQQPAGEPVSQPS